MRCAVGFPCAALLAWSLAIAGHPSVESGQGQPIALGAMVGPGDPLASHDLHFDFTFAREALDYLRSGDASLLTRLAHGPAATHMLNHARNFDSDVPQESAEALVSHLLTPRSGHMDGVEACSRSLAFFSGPLLEDPHWVADDLRYLPEDFRFHGTLFLTFGYDIGVAFDSTASLNCAHPHFNGHVRELTYYAIHELHHLGFMAYQAPPRVSELKTCGDLLGLMEYSTQMEGMAVLAAWDRRRADGALSDDEDYVALQDARRMQREEMQYFRDLRYLEGRATQAADAKAWAVIERMSSGERLWYRVGAHMARRIEQASGRPALVALIKTGPARFIAAYRQAADRGNSSAQEPAPRSKARY